jgi:hypothetical protein
LEDRRRVLEPSNDENYKFGWLQAPVKSLEAQQLLIAEACNHPNCLALRFSFPMVRVAAQSRELCRDRLAVLCTVSDMEAHGRHCESLEAGRWQRHCVSVYRHAYRAEFRDSACGQLTYRDLPRPHRVEAFRSEWDPRPHSDYFVRASVVDRIASRSHT